MRAIAFAAAACGIAASASAETRGPAAAGFPAALDGPTLTQWLHDNSRLPPAKVVSVGASSIIALRSVAPAGPPNPSFFRASIWAEVISPAAAASGGYLSWSAEMDVDCQARRSKAVKAVNYPQRNLQGQAKPASGAEEWVTPNAGTQLYSLISAVCDPNFRRPFATASVKSEPAALASAADRPVVAAPPPPAPPPPKTPDAAEDKPTVAAKAEPKATARDETPAKPPPAAGAVRRPIPLGRSSAAVQLAASDSEAQAQAALKAAQRKFAQTLQGLDGRVVKVTVGGKPVYRALIHGFAARSGAIAVCEALQASRQACFVRNDFAPGTR